MIYYIFCIPIVTKAGQELELLAETTELIQQGEYRGKFKFKSFKTRTTTTQQTNNHSRVTGNIVLDKVLLYRLYIHTYHTHSYRHINVAKQRSQAKAQAQQFQIEVQAAFKSKRHGTTDRQVFAKHSDLPRPPVPTSTYVRDYPKKEEEFQGVGYGTWICISMITRSHGPVKPNPNPIPIPQNRPPADIMSFCIY